MQATVISHRGRPYKQARPWIATSWKSMEIAPCNPIQLAPRMQQRQAQFSTGDLVLVGPVIWSLGRLELQPPGRRRRLQTQTRTPNPNQKSNFQWRDKSRCKLSC